MRLNTEQRAKADPLLQEILEHSSTDEDCRVGKSDIYINHL